MKRQFKVLAAMLPLLLIACMSCSKDENEIEGLEIPVDFYAAAHPYTFSEELKSDKWKALDSEDRDALFQIPKSKLEKMDEMDIAMTCVFFYPRRFDILTAENNPIAAIGRRKDCNNGLNKMFNMPQAADALLSILKNYDVLQNLGNADKFGLKPGSEYVSVKQQAFICCVLTSDVFAEKMSEEARLKVQNEIGRIITGKKNGAYPLLETNYLYAVYARMLAYSKAVTEEEKDCINGLLGSYMLSTTPYTELTDLIDSIMAR